MKEIWSKYLDSFGVYRFFKLRHDVQTYCEQKNLLISADSLKETISWNNLWWMLYL